MKQKIFGLALVSMSLIAFSGMAQNNAPSQKNEKIENVKKQKANRPERKPKADPFADLNLTDAQKSQLQQLNEKTREARKQQMQAQKESKKRDHEARMTERREAKKQYLAEVKSILGEDKYVTFLENMYINAGNNHKTGKAPMGNPRNMKNKKDAKGDKGKKHDGKRQGKPAKEDTANS